MARKPPAPKPKPALVAGRTRFCPQCRRDRDEAGGEMRPASAIGWRFVCSVCLSRTKPPTRPGAEA